MPVPTPRDSFDSAREAGRADRVWQKSAQLLGHWKPQSTHDILNNAA